MDNKLPEGWICSTISSIANVKGGKRLPKGKSFSNSLTNHPYLRVTDFQDGNIITLGLKYIDEDTFNDISTYTINKGDLYISIAGTIGLVGSIPDYLDGANLTENAAKICDIEINKNYLKFFLNSNYAKNQFIEKTVSSGQPKLALFRIRDCELFVAPLPEQKVIAEKLDSLLAQVESTKARLESIPGILKQFRQSVLAAAVSGELTEDWRERQSFQEINITHDNKLPKIADHDKFLTSPRAWKWVRLGSISTLINGDRGKNYPNNSEYVEKGIPFINTGHIEPDGTLSSSRMNYITQEKYKSLGSGEIKKGDLVYCLRGATMGKTAKVDYEVGAIASSLVIIRVSEGLSNIYAYFFLISPSGRELIKQYDNGSAQPNLSAKSLASYAIPLPPIEEQEEIVRRVEELFGFADKVAAQVKTAMESVNHLTQSILAQAFSGELTKDWREQNPDLISGENSAAALLERIKAEREKLKAGKKG